MKMKTQLFVTLMVMLPVGMVYAQQQPTTSTPASPGLADQLKPARPSAQQQESPSPVSQASRAAQNSGSMSTSELQPVKILHRVPPIYPPEARDKRLSSSIVVKVLVGKDGKAGQVTLVSGHPSFLGAVTTAVKQWKFKAATLNGKPIDQNMQFRFDFSDERAGAEQAAP